MLTTFAIFSLAGLSLHVPWVQQQWELLVESQGDSCWVTVVIPWTIGVIVYWMFGLMMLAVEMWRYPSWIFKRKIQDKVALQTQGSQLQPPLLRCFRVVLLNQFVFMLPTLLATVRMFVLHLYFPFTNFAGLFLPGLYRNTNRQPSAVAAAHGTNATHVAVALRPLSPAMSDT
jgi:hypothetical protein